MAILLQILIPIALVYWAVHAIGKRWPTLGTFICRYKYLFCLACLGLFLLSVRGAIERDQKGFGLGMLIVAVAFTFLPSKKQFSPKDPRK